jgi:transposase-like protein
MSSTHRVRHRTRPDPSEPPVTAETSNRRGPYQRSGSYSNQSTVDPFNLSGEPYTQPAEALSQNIAVRARQVGQMNPEYSEEFILQALNQMLIARVPKDQIAQRFGVTTRTIYNWEVKLKDKMRREAKEMDPASFLGESLEFYKQLRAAGMAMFLTGANLREKQIGMEQARSAHNDMHKFLHLAGFYDVVKFQPSNAAREDQHVVLAEEVAQGARDILSAFEFLDGDFIEVEQGQASS